MQEFSTFYFIHRFKGSREVFDGDKYQISSDGNTYSLSVRDVFGEDADEYVVRASNKAGSKTSRADLEISCKSFFLKLIIVPPHLKNVLGVYWNQPVCLSIWLCTKYY